MFPRNQSEFFIYIWMIPTEIGLVIGAITESQELINQALEIEKRMGGQMNMCTALEELKKEGIQEGEIKGTIKMSKKSRAPKAEGIPYDKGQR